MVISNPAHWVEEGFFQGPKYDKIVEMITEINAIIAAVPSHASSHQDSGSDEINVAGLSGELADNQPPKSHDNTAHSTNYEAANANIQSHVGTPPEDSHHAKTHNNTEHSTNYEAANANIQSHVGTPPEDSHHAKTHDNTEHSTNYEAANANIQSHVASPPTDSHHAQSHTHDSHSGTLSANEGGTGQSVYAVGDILYAATTTTLARLTAATSSWVLTAQGVDTAPIWQAPGAPGSHALDSASHSDIATITEAKGMLLWWNGTGWAGLTAPGTVGHILVCDNVDGTISWQEALASGERWFHIGAAGWTATDDPPSSWWCEDLDHSVRLADGGSNTDYLHADVHLPDGVTVIETSSFGYINTGTTTLTLRLYRKEIDSSSVSIMAQWTVTDTGGGSTTSDVSITNPIIDNENYLYFMKLAYYSNSVNQSLVANVTIHYTL